jgi:hypothetical protein
MVLTRRLRLCVSLLPLWSTFCDVWQAQFLIDRFLGRAHPWGMTTEKMFAAFGGREVIMSITGAKRSAINNWSYAGVPYKHWPALLTAAEKRGLSHVVNLRTLKLTRRVREIA